MNKKSPTLLLVLLMGCASFGPMDEFNYTMNKSAVPCNINAAGTCHPLWPTRIEIAAAKQLECTGYVMTKAYALAALGVGEERMRVAVFWLGTTGHAVLVIDGKITLDNLSDSARSFDEYGRFNPVLIPVPWRI